MHGKDTAASGDTDEQRKENKSMISELTEPIGEPIRAIPNHAGYGASADGRIWSRWRRGRGGLLDSWREKIMPTDRYGYRVVGLRIAGKPFSRTVHRLVLLTFVGPCPEGLECCHANGNPSDNRIVNLRWGTRAENESDRHRHLVESGEPAGKSNLTRADVLDVRRLLRLGARQRTIALKYRLSESAIGKIATGRHYTHVREVQSCVRAR